MGVLIVSAVGNDYAESPDVAYYPAAYDSVVGVGAYDGTGAAAFSGRIGVSVVAPGVNIAAVTNRNEAKAVLKSGTSYACAYVSAARNSAARRCMRRRAMSASRALMRHAGMDWSRWRTALSMCTRRTGFMTVC